MVRVAILGAAGFVGGRAVEMLHLGGLAEVRPVVRGVASMARLARFDLDCRAADARDEPALRRAFDGCEVVVHAVAGDPPTILASAAAAYRAAQRAGVRRLVYLSSASVHGQAPAPGTHEDTPLDDRQPIAYNNAKVRAERELRRLRESGAVELVLLRPGIVFGPRSAWVTGFASDLLAGRAYVVDGGRGICNSIYVDNLVHAVALALDAPAADRQALLVGDGERVTWADLYRPVAAALGLDMAQVADVGHAPAGAGLLARARAVVGSAAAKRAAAVLPTRLRRAAWAGLEALLAEPSGAEAGWELPAPAGAQAPPAATLEMALLHRCRTQLPIARAEAVLGYRPAVTFAEGVRRTIAWLDFAGYPVVGGADGGTTP